MKHLLLKFNHGLERGAHLAYIGHYKRTKDVSILIIANDEAKHSALLVAVLKSFGHKPSRVIDSLFVVIGKVIAIACSFAPLWSLDYIAKVMELFAVGNYKSLGDLYPEQRALFHAMAEAETHHANYFARNSRLGAQRRRIATAVLFEERK